MLLFVLSVILLFDWFRYNGFFVNVLRLMVIFILLLLIVNNLGKLILLLFVKIILVVVFKLIL